MKWQEVRELYPNQFVKFEIIESHQIDTKEYVDEVSIIKAIENGKLAVKEFTKCKNRQVVYSTKNEEIIIELVKNTGVRRNI